jgi:hypothetical protein
MPHAQLFPGLSHFFPFPMLIDLFRRNPVALMHRVDESVPRPSVFVSDEIASAAHAAQKADVVDFEFPRFVVIDDPMASIIAAARIARHIEMQIGYWNQACHRRLLWLPHSGS